MEMEDDTTVSCMSLVFVLCDYHAWVTLVLERTQDC